MTYDLMEASKTKAKIQVRRSPHQKNGRCEHNARHRGLAYNQKENRRDDL
jgi:hypothetical protein